MKFNALPYLLVLSVALAILLVLYVASGPVNMSPQEVLQALLAGPDARFASTISLFAQSPNVAVVWDIRMPRALTCVLVGCALAVSGAIIQGLFRNPLADPGLIGVSSGSAVGAGIAILGYGTFESLFSHLPAVLEGFYIPLFSVVGAFLVTSLVYRIGRMAVSTSMTTMLLTGVAINAIAAAALHFMTYLADDGKLRNITFWMMGSFSSSSWQNLMILAPCCLGLMLAARRLANPLNALLLGESEARHLGYSVTHTRRVVISIVALAVGVSVAFTGMIGFVGLVVPHLVRLSLGPSHHTLIPASALLGGCLMLCADWISRLIVSPAELPIGIVTAILGGPFFIYLILSQKRERSL